MTKRQKMSKPFNEITADFWAMYETRSPHDVFVIPTNGSVNVHGDAVMGRGLALDAKQKFTKIEERFGTLIRHDAYKNRLQTHYFKDEQLIMFPVKYKWYMDADPELIAHSCKQLNAIVLFELFEHIYVPRVGCGNGKLSWEKDVKPILEKYLDGRYTVIYNGA